MAKIEYGINLNPNPNDPNDFLSKPKNAADLQGLKWARIVFKVAAARFADLPTAFAAYDPLIDSYNQQGVRTLLVLNQETFWGEGLSAKLEALPLIHLHVCEPQYVNDPPNDCIFT